MRKIIILIIGFVIGGNLFAADNSIENIQLPQESGIYQNQLTDVTNTKLIDKWSEFETINGQWTAIVDKYTETPVRAFGKPIGINGFTDLDENNIEKAAMKFLTDNADYLNINANSLVLTRASKVRDLWYVSFKQQYKGFDVLLSEIELRINKKNKVMAIGIKYFNNIDVKTDAVMQIDDAIRKSFNNIKSNNVSFQSKSDNMFILPVLIDGEYQFKPVYNFNIKNNEDLQTYTNYIDATDGTVLWRYQTSHNALSSVKIKGDIQKESPNSEIEEDIFPFLKFKINDKEYETDANGENTLVNIEDGDVLTLDFQGKYVHISYQYGNPSVYRDTIENANQNLNIKLDNTNSNQYERFGFYHLNVIRNWIKEIDPQLDAMDGIIDVIFMEDYYGYKMTNAFSSATGDTIAFIDYTNSEARLSLSPSVLYHEYGHAINTKLYMAEGSTNGMRNSSLHEALADVTSSLILDDPRVGANVFKSDPDKVIRNIDNDNKYPEDISGDSHYNGLILAAAVWDIRNEISLDYAKEVSHYARYGLPDDPDIGTCFNEYFIEFLIAADDDGDLSNGTPYFEEIVTAFNRHNIGTNLMISNTFAHTPLENTEEFQYPYTVEFSFNPPQIYGVSLDSAFVTYSYDGMKTVEKIEATEYEDFKFTADIPSTGKAEMIDYQIIYYVSGINEKNIQPFSQSSYSFLAGYVTVIEDNIEDDDAWQLGFSEDNGYAQFELDVPTGLSFSYGGTRLFIQPAEDHSETGTKCLVTGADVNYQSITSTMLNRGTTSAISPTYDISSYDSPLIKFYYWIKTLAYANVGNPKNPLIVYATKDKGFTWTEIDRIEYRDVEWAERIVMLPQELIGTEELQIRFTAQCPADNQLPTEVLVDDLEIIVPSPISSITENENESVNIYPNPFNDILNINSVKDLKIFDLHGNLVKSIPSGINTWDGTNESGIEVESGVYILRIYDNNKVINKKVIKH